MSQNMQKFSSVLEGLLLQTGIDMLNPTFDSGLEWSKSMGAEPQCNCCPRVIVKPDRLASTDKTEGTTNQSGGSTKHGDFKNLIWVNGIDLGETLCNKTLQQASLQGGSFSSGKSLLPMAMWPCAVEVGWTLNSPTSNVVCPAVRASTCRPQVGERLDRVSYPFCNTTFWKPTLPVGFLCTMSEHFFD